MHTFQEGEKSVISYMCHRGDEQHAGILGAVGINRSPRDPRATVQHPACYSRQWASESSQADNKIGACSGGRQNPTISSPNRPWLALQVTGGGICTMAPLPCVAGGTRSSPALIPPHFHRC